MSREYQFDRNAYNPYEQDYDSGYSSQNREYRELYNPFKSNWERALKDKTKKHGFKDSSSSSKPKDSSRFTAERGASSFPGNQTWSNQKLGSTTRPVNSNKQITQDEEGVFDSGFNINRRNAYGYHTTGYGPRD